jgi:GntR family galactonate operon transcriptional repressor
MYHTVLLTASHNQVFRRLSSAIHAALKYALHASNIGVENREDAVRVHGQLVEALRMRDKAPRPRMRQPHARSCGARPCRR